MGIDLATWRARIGLNCYHMCRPLQTRWRSSGGRLYQPGVVSWGVGEVMNDTPLVLKGCMTVVALSLILQYVVHSWSNLKGRGGGGKVCCHRQGTTSQVRGAVDGGGTLLLRAAAVVIPLLLVIAGDVEMNPGPEGIFLVLKCVSKCDEYGCRVKGCYFPYIHSNKYESTTQCTSSGSCQLVQDRTRVGHPTH